MTAPVAETLDEVLAPDHLSAALGERHPGVRVESARALDVGHGVATRTAVELTYAPGGGRGLPTRMFLKAGFEGEATAHLLGSGLFLREARFYRDIAPTLSVPTPRCYYAGPDEATGQGVLQLEDLTGRAEFPGLGGALAVDEAEVFARELAGLHAARWADGDAPDLAWLPDLDAVAQGPFRSDPDRLRRNLAGARGAVAPVAVADPDRIAAGFGAFAGWATTEPACLVHGDSHGGNIFHADDGRHGWFDWQMLHRGHWALDLSYLLAGCLTVDDHARHVRSLLAAYLDALGRAGADTPGADAAWGAYRRATAFGLFVWATVRESIIPVETCVTMFERYAVAAADADVFGALR